MEKFKEIIKVSYYFAGSGYSSSEIAVNETVVLPFGIDDIDAEDYREFITDWTENNDNEDRWYKVEVELYEESSDPMFDDPAKKIEFFAEWKNGELEISED